MALSWVNVRRLEDKIKSHSDFPTTDQDGIAPLRIVKTITYTFEERRQMIDSLLDIKERFYSFRQGKNMPLQRYHELFVAQVEVLDEVGVSITDVAAVEPVAASNGRPNVPMNSNQALFIAHGGKEKVYMWN
jgi:hypothetical protein